MKTKIILSLAFTFFISLGLNAQKRIQLSDNILTTTYDLSGYSAIDVSDDFEVTLNHTAADTPISLKANENLMEYVEIRKDGRTLLIQLNTRGNTWFKGKMVLDLVINTSSIITDFNISDDAILTVKSPVKLDVLDLEVRGDGIFKATIEVDKLNLTAKSDAEVFLNGTAQSMTAFLSSDSELNASELSIQDLTINLRGDSEASVKVSNKLDATATGDSELRYAGNPTSIRQSARGDSDIISMN